MFSILNRALSWTITSSGNKFYLKMRSRLIKASNNRFYVKFMQLEIGLLPQTMLDKIVGTFSYVFFKVLKNFHNQELTFKTLSVR